MRRLLCLVFGHSTFAGTDPRRALVFHCPRCRRLVIGGLGLRRLS